jgi:Zn finger protein HypA/HybF involved in hydrogenase expression
MTNPLDGKGFKFRYSSGIAPLITTTEYADLIKNYKATGRFPHILNLGGMAIDTSRNRNKWRVPIEDLQAIADQLKGAPLMKDHDIDHVDSIIGKVEDAWVEKDEQDEKVGKVLWAGQTSDESLIQKILLGYVRFNSIQIAVPQAYCDNCIAAQGKSEEQAAIDDLDLPCPRCGSLDMLIRRPMVLEQSMVAIPAYEKAEVTPIGFKASLDRTLQKRFEPHEAAKKTKVTMPDLTPVLVSAFDAVATAIVGVSEITLRMAQLEMGGVEEGYEETKGGSLEDFPLVEKGGAKKVGEEEDRKDQYFCYVHDKSIGRHTDAEMAEDASLDSMFQEKEEGVSEYVGRLCPECKVSEMVGDEKGGAKCPNCGWPN